MDPFEGCMDVPGSLHAILREKIFDINVKGDIQHIPRTSEYNFYGADESGNHFLSYLMACGRERQKRG